MNLALVGPTYPYRGGIAHHTTMLYHALASCEHRVSLYSFRRQYPSWLFPGRTDRDMSALKLSAECEYTLDSLNPLTWWATARVIRAHQPAVLILQWWVPFFAPMWMVLARSARRAGIKVLFICHNVLPHEQRPWDAWLARGALGLGDGFIVHSQEERARLSALLPGRRAAVMPLPTFVLSDQTCTRDEARRQLGLQPEVPVLLFFGLVREYKGLRHLLAAMPAIRSELADVRLLIAGEFWEDKRLYLERVAQLGIGTSVTVIDRYIPNEELPTYFAAADVAVLPYDHVTQSAVAQLAFGFNLPVITTHVGGLAEIISDGHTGLLVPPGDPAALAQAVIRYFREGCRERMAQAIEQARPQFDWRNLVRLIEEMAT